MTELKWGLGVEKEFPILIGPYKLSVYENIIQLFVNQFDLTFSFCSDDIKTKIRNKIVEFQKVDCYMLVPQTTIGMHGFQTQNIIDNDKCTDEFYINYKHIHINFFKIYNEDFLKYVSTKNFQHIDSNEQNKFQEFIIYWNDFVFELTTTHHGVLPLFVGSRILQKISAYAMSLFPQIKLFVDSKKQPFKYKGISDFIKWEFNITFNPTLQHNKYEDEHIDLENNCEYKRKIMKWGDRKFEQKILNFNYPKLDDDSGGYELRTFSKEGETFMNKTPFECGEDLVLQEKELYTQLREILSLWEINHNVDINFQMDFASYYMPILNFHDYNTCAIELNQIYSGETEINITLPYLPHNKLNSSNIDYLIPNRYVSKSKLLSNNQDESRKEYEKSFKIRHTYLMKTLQLLSPLFWACMTGVVYFSFGDNATIPETSKRFHSYANYRILTKQNLDTIYEKNHPHYSFQMNDVIANILEESNIKPSFTNAYEFSVNRNEKKYAPEKDNYFGFEWKVLDQYPTAYVEHICLLIIMIAQWLHNKKIDSWIFDETKSVPDILYQYVPDIKRWFNEILFQGWNSHVNPHYAALVMNTLQFKKFPYMSTETCFHFLNGIHSNLYRYFKKTHEDIWIISSFFPDFYNLDDEKFMNLPNINQMNYDKMMDDFQHYFPDIFLDRGLQVGESTTNEDYVDMEFWENPN